MNTPQTVNDPLITAGQKYARGKNMRRQTVGISLSLAVALLSGCELLEKKPAADTPEATENTAYHLCGGCHGPKDIRVNNMSAKIIGQKKGYLAAKLKDYRDGKRVHPWMNGVAKDLTDQDIENLAAYYANFKPKPKPKP